MGLTRRRGRITWLLLALTVCSCRADGQSEPPGAAQPLVPTQVIQRSDSSTLAPLQPFMLSWRELTLVNHARSLLLKDCLAQSGIPFAVTDLDTALAQAKVAEREDASRLFGITDASTAKLHGYWPAPSASMSPGSVQGNETAIQACAQQADRTLDRRADRSAYGLARELLIQSHQKLSTDREAQVAIRSWSACMRNFGYRVTSPVDDQGDIKHELQERSASSTDTLEAPPSRREIEMALTDIGCKVQTQLVQRLRTAVFRIEQTSRAANRQALVEDRARLDQVLLRTTEVLHQAGASSRREDAETR